MTGDHTAGVSAVSLILNNPEQTTFSSSLASGVAINARGTNQNITLTPSGTGQARVVVSGTDAADNDVLTLRVNQNGTGTGATLNFMSETGTDARLGQIIARRTSTLNGYTDFDFTSWNGTGPQSRMKLIGGASGAGGLAIYATTASTSTTTGALTVAGGAGINGRTSTSTLNVGATNGTTADLIASATATLDFPSISAGGSEDLTITVTGASVGDSVHLGLPAAPAAGIVFSAFVSAANTITVRASNITGSPVDPASATYRVTVISY
jgi:hypothetical protein